MDNINDCPVCFEEMDVESGNIQCLPCEHRFCKGCYDKWYAANIVEVTCPTCHYIVVKKIRNGRFELEASNNENCFLFCIQMNKYKLSFLGILLMLIGICLTINGIIKARKGT